MMTHMHRHAIMKTVLQTTPLPKWGGKNMKSEQQSVGLLKHSIKILEQPKKYHFFSKRNFKRAEKIKNPLWAFPFSNPKKETVLWRKSNESPGNSKVW